MKDLLIAIAALLILTAVFSYGIPPTTPPDTGSTEQSKIAGDSGEVESGGGNGGFTTPIEQPKPPLSVGDKVMLTDTATVYRTTVRFAPWVYTTVLYVRQIDDNGRVVVSTNETGAVTGSVDEGHLVRL